MIYKVIKTNKNNMSDDDFINVCNNVFRKTCLVGLLLVLGTGAFLCLTKLFINIDLLRSVFLALTGLSSIVTLIVLMLLLGNFAGDGIIIERFGCKELKDWIRFAERQVINHDALILSKRLEVEQKEIYEVALDSTELRCKNMKTDAVEIIKLKKPFAETFVIMEDVSLGEGEMVIDLSGKELTAYVNKKPVSQELSFGTAGTGMVRSFAKPTCNSTADNKED